jgi:hypothetical protein
MTLSARFASASDAAAPQEGQVRRKILRESASDASAKSLKILPLPKWAIGRGHARTVRSGQGPNSLGQGLTDDAFAAGAALFALDQILRAEPVFLGALRMRIALHAAVAASRLLRVRRDEAELRDTLQLTRAGDEPGLAGRGHILMRRLCACPTRLAGAVLDDIGSLGKSDGLTELLALVQADIALAERLGWNQPLPLHVLVIHDPAFRRGEEGRRIRIGEPGWGEIGPAVMARAAVHAHQLAVTLAGRAERLIAAAGTLRTRDGGAGVVLILRDDCVAPWRMTGEGGAVRRGHGMSSDRAARRLCESLHAQGALRRLTPRPAFRLYGL